LTASPIAVSRKRRQIHFICTMKYKAISLCFLFFLSVACGWLISFSISLILGKIVKESSPIFWLARFTTSVFSYGTVFLPCFVIVYFTKKHQLHTRDGYLWKLLRILVTGNTSETESKHSDVSYSSVNPSHDSNLKTGLQLIGCTVGLQASFLTWGVLQEKIFTEYVDSEGHVEKFTDSEFLVFMNCILSFIISGTYLLLKPQTIHQTPLYKYGYCSLSNILSSWCQYEALKFVSFPSQVLTKSTKVIPVMLMGKLVSRTKYKNYEYLTAILISVGMTAFLFGSMKNEDETKSTTTSGAVLLMGYLLFDSFTANWQGYILREHHPSSIQMMCGINFMSCLFSSVSLIQESDVLYSLHFALRNPQFILDCSLTAIASASGQLFIYATISKFGVVVFTIIMTCRQALAILISCLVYGHYLSTSAIIGVTIVFFAIFLRIYYGHCEKNKAKTIQVDHSDVIKA